MTYNDYLNSYYMPPTYPQATIQQPQPQMPANQFVYIQGKDAAKAYPLSPNTTLLFLDDQNPYIYRKKTDKDGRTIEFKVFRLEEEIDTPEIQESNFATKDDLAALSGSIFDAINDLKGMIRSNKPYGGKRGQYNGESANRQ